MKNNSETKYLLVGKTNGQFEVLRASEDKQICIDKMKSIDVGNSKYAYLQVLAPKEETK